MVDFEADLMTERETVEAMTATMALRGPDAGGTWLSPHAALGHRRLAVIDVEGGVQPMEAEGVVLTYSGEVYNYRELRAELEAAGRQFRTASDTEVVLHAYLEWGIDFLDRLNGMYAFAIWDGRSEELLLVRDRLGIKPLFYYPLSDGVLVGSEPKAILANPLAKRRVDKRGICSVLLPIREPGFTPFQGLLELRAGNYLRVSRSGSELKAYWTIEARPHEDDLETTVATVRELLEDIVPRQLISDVPLCMLLSGGLDSSVLVALARRVEGRGESLRTLAEAPHLDGEDEKEHRMREVMHMHLTRFLPYLLDRKDRMSMASGLEVRVPFCDHRLVDEDLRRPREERAPRGDQGPRAAVDPRPPEVGLPPHPGPPL